MRQLTREQPAKDFLCDGQHARRQHIGLTLSLVCALSPCARVRLPRSPTAASFKATYRSHFRVDLWFEWWGGKEREESSRRTSSLRVSRRSLRIGTAAWGVGTHHSRKIPDPALLCLTLAQLLLHESTCAHWFLPGSPLAKFDWLSLTGGGEGRKSHLGPGHCIAYF